MTSNPTISIISPDSVTVFYGGRPFILEATDPRYADLVQALAAKDAETIDNIIHATNRLTKALGQYGDITVFAGQVTFQGRPIHNNTVDRVLKMTLQGRDPEAYALFLDRVMRNPTREAADMLLDWVERAGLPILPDGRFLAYRYVREDYLDGHTGSMDNSPGRIIELPRSKCDENYNNTCSAGLHFCNHGYLSSMSGYRCLIMAECPSDVVSFPQDSGGQKGRTQRHEALFEISMEEAQTGIFFKGEDELVFGWDRVQHYRREQLRFLVKEGEDAQEYLDAHDAGWRVCWNGGENWGVYDPAGLQYAIYTTRSTAYAGMVQGYTETAETADADETPTDLAFLAEIVTGVVDTTEVTFNSRLEALETALNILNADGTFADRLDRIEREIGLPQGTPPQIDRLVRAEQAAGL